MDDELLDAIAGAIIKSATEVKRLSEGESSENFTARLMWGRRKFNQYWNLKSIDHPDRIVLFVRHLNGHIQFSLAVIDDYFVSQFRENNAVVKSSRWYNLPVPNGSWRNQVSLFLRPGTQNATVLPRVKELLRFAQSAGHVGPVINIDTKEYRADLKDSILEDEAA